MKKSLVEIEGLLKVSGKIQWYGDMPIIPPYPVDPNEHKKQSDISSNSVTKKD